MSNLPELPEGTLDRVNALHQSLFTWWNQYAHDQVKEPADRFKSDRPAYRAGSSVLSALHALSDAVETYESVIRP